MQVFSGEICKNFKNTFSQNTSSGCFCNFQVNYFYIQFLEIYQFLSDMVLLEKHIFSLTVPNTIEASSKFLKQSTVKRLL